MQCELQPFLHYVCGSYPTRVRSGESSLPAVDLRLVPSRWWDFSYAYSHLPLLTLSRYFFFSQSQMFPHLVYDIPTAGSRHIIGWLASNLDESSTIIPLCPGIQRNSTASFLARLFTILWHSRVSFESTVGLYKHMHILLLLPPCIVSLVGVTISVISVCVIIANQLRETVIPLPSCRLLFTSSLFCVFLDDSKRRTSLWVFSHRGD